MSLKFHWFLPTNGGDGRHVVGGGHGVGGRRRRAGPPSVAYLGQIARAAEQLGFEAALTPTGAWCEDAWLSTAMLSQVTERLKFLVAFRPGLISPTLAAQMAATFQSLSGGRLLLNVVTGGESHEQRMFGDFLDKDARYARCDEFLHVVRGAVARRDRRLPRRAPPGRGRHARRRSPTRCPRSTSAAPRRPPARSPPGTPTSTSPGASRRPRSPRRSPGSASSPPSAGPRAALRHPAARHHPRHRRGGLGRGRPAARRHRPGRRSRRSQAGLRAQRVRGPAADARRCTAAARDDLEIYPNLWAGVGLVRGGAGTALVGSHERGRRPDRGVRRRSASTSSSSPATRTWRRPTGSARACCRSSPSAAAGSTPLPPRSYVAGGAVRRRRGRVAR